MGDEDCVVCKKPVKHDKDRGTYVFEATETHAKEKGEVHVTCIAPKTMNEWAEERLRSR